MLNPNNNESFHNLNIHPINPLQNVQIENRNEINQIKDNIKNIDEKNNLPIKIKQSIKASLGLNFKKFKNSFSNNISNFSPDKLYFLAINLKSRFEYKNKNKMNIGEYISKYNAQKFELISNNILSKERDFKREFIEENNILKNKIDNLSIINNITSEFRKLNMDNPYNYMQENPDFDFNNNKMGIYMLLQQNGNYGKIFNKKNKIFTSNKICNEHKRRKVLKKKEKNLDKNQKQLQSFNRIISSSSFINKSGNLNILTKSKDYIKNKQSIESSMNINILKHTKNYLIEEENNLFEKYFNSFIPYFKELIENRRINKNDKIFKLREVLNMNIFNFREGRKNLCEFMKQIITPINNNDNIYEFTTKSLIARVIKYLEKDFENKNYISTKSQTINKKEDFISNYTNNIIYTYFSNVTNNSQSQTISLWGKIFFFIRFGWKKECIEFINSIEGMYINESGLRELKESLNDSIKINIQNYNEFKRIINQERKEENPFKHACMVYITKIPDQLYNNILLEINDHLWFNLNLINPQENYKHLIKKEKEKEDKDNIFEINTNSNQINNDRIIELIKLKDLQIFFEKINPQELLNLNNKNTNFAYIILLSGLLKFKDALSFMIKNNMYIDAINFYFILQQLGIYSNFDEINEKIIIPKKKYLGEKVNELEEIYQIYPRVSNNIPALILYLIFSDDNLVQPLSYLLLETESFWVLNNYHKRTQLFEKNIKNNYINYNNSINTLFNVCLQDLIDENTLIIICKNIFELLLKHEMRKNENLNPLFNTFKDLKMLTELTGILINKSIELIKLKQPIISEDNNGKFSISLLNEENKRFFGYSLIMNYFGSLINDVNKLYIDKQNEKGYLIQNNINNIYNERIYILKKEIEENNIPISLLKQLPIIENIYELIFIRNFHEAYQLFTENIYIVQVCFNSQKKDYITEFNIFMNEVIAKMKYGLIGLYPDILYFYTWLFRYELVFFQGGNLNNIEDNKRHEIKALEFMLDRLVEISQNDINLMEYSAKFKMAREEVNKMQQFYHQNNYLI